MIRNTKIRFKRKILHSVVIFCPDRDTNTNILEIFRILDFT